MGEMALGAYCRQHGMKTVSCRIFTAYGERENETHAVIAWIARAFVRQDPFVIWGTGQQDRNFTYVGDIVEGLMRAAERVHDGSAVNLGTGEHIKIIDAVRLILDLTDHAPNLEFDLTKPVGVLSRAADLQHSREVLGWEPRTSFAEGVRKTIDWYFQTHDPDYVRLNLDRLLMERAGEEAYSGAPARA
jgi:UDP-glucose 4-epimerase